jgi:beta-lactamase class A
MEAAVTRRPLALATALALAVALCPGKDATAAEPSPKEAALLAKLRKRILAVDEQLDGVLGVYVRDLTTGATIDLRPDEVFPTASSIKLAVLYELYRQAGEGRIDLAEVTRPPVPRAGGGGVLQELGERVSLTWRDLAVLMIGWSDNEATNVLIRRVGTETTNRRLDSLGLPRTRLRRLMMDLDAARRGDENVSTPRELARLAEVVAKGESLAPAGAADILGVATVSDGGSPFRRGLPAGVRAISKPGGLEGVRCEAAWVDVPGRPYSAAIMASYLRREVEGESAIAELSAAIYDTFDRLARSSEHGRVLTDRVTPK